MSKDTGELIKKKSINLCCQPILVISRVWLLCQMPRFPRACHIYVNRYVYVQEKYLVRVPHMWGHRPAAKVLPLK